jgi:hypothetical protein
MSIRAVTSRFAGVLDGFIERTGPTGDIPDMTLGLFSGFGEGNDRINLSTLHSAKGREFADPLRLAHWKGSGGRPVDGRFVPLATNAPQQTATLFDHLVG